MIINVVQRVAKVDELFTRFICLSKFPIMFFRTLSGKFGTAYREFLSEDSRVRYICLLNPKDLDMFVLVTTGTDDLIQVGSLYLPDLCKLDYEQCMQMFLKSIQLFRYVT